MRRTAPPAPAPEPQQARLAALEQSLIQTHRNLAVPLAEVCESHFGMTYREACRAATLHRLPVPAFKLRDSRKSPWMLSVAHLAAHIEASAQASADEWERMRI